MDWNEDCSPASSCLLDFVLDFEDTYSAYLIDDFPLSKVFLERNLKKLLSKLNIFEYESDIFKFCLGNQIQIAEFDKEHMMN